MCTYMNVYILPFKKPFGGAIASWSSPCLDLLTDPFPLDSGNIKNIRNNNKRGNIVYVNLERQPQA